MKARLCSDFTRVMEGDDCSKQREQPLEPLIVATTDLKPTDAVVDGDGGDIALNPIAA